MNGNDLAVAYDHSNRNRVEILRSALCGCFHCVALFDTSAIKLWIDTGQTAVCPRCGMDAVLGAESGFELTPEFLSRMKDRWFRASKTA